MLSVVAFPALTVIFIWSSLSSFCCRFRLPFWNGASTRKVMRGASPSATMRRSSMKMMKMKTLVLCSVLFASILAGQDSTFKLNVNVDLKEVHVNVTDQHDRPVGNLKKENFRIFEDRNEQSITVFKHEDMPVSLGLVIDNSRSIEPRKQRLDAAALSFVRK